jgi:hypothetical protein
MIYVIMAWMALDSAEALPWSSAPIAVLFKKTIHVKPPYAYERYNEYIQRSKLVAIKAWCDAHPGEEYVFHVGRGEDFERQAKRPHEEVQLQGVPGIQVMAGPGAGGIF